MKAKQNKKRSVLQTSACLFDPFGFLTPFTIRVKYLFQKLWERGIGWDDQLPQDLAEEWNQWCSELQRLHLVAIPRWYHIEIQPDMQSVQLHIYCDASEKAYSTVAYMQGKNQDGEIITSFVASKSRVAPLKKLTLPRLELMGALKSLSMQKNQLKMWTDSMITLHWIRSTAQRWKPFVENRVTEIQSLTNPESWSHINGKNNPDDLPTRGLSVDNLIQSQLWWNGPTAPLPVEPTDTTEEHCIAEDANVDLRTKFAVAVQFTSTDPAEPLLNLDKYSRLRTVFRITAWVKRFVQNACTRQKTHGELTAEELTASEMYWVKVTQ